MHPPYRTARPLSNALFVTHTHSHLPPPLPPLHLLQHLTIPSAITSPSPPPLPPHHPLLPLPLPPTPFLPLTLHFPLRTSSDSSLSSLLPSLPLPSCVSAFPSLSSPSPLPRYLTREAGVETLPFRAAQGSLRRFFINISTLIRILSFRDREKTMWRKDSLSRRTWAAPHGR